MDEMTVKIEQLKSLRAQTRRWRLAGIVSILCVVLGCLLYVRHRTLALVNDGPAHDQFVAQLKTGLARDAVPEVKRLTVKTLDRLGPAMQKELERVEKRTPQLTARVEAEMNQLRENLPVRAERALKPTIGHALEGRLASWRVQYPSLTLEQLTEASGRLGNEANERMANVAATVMLPYEGALEKIVDDLALIRKLEAGHDDVDTWDLAVVSLGLMHEELAKLNPETRRLFAASVTPKEKK